MARIVWFHPRPIYPPRGGGEIRAAGLIRSARAHGHDVRVVSLGKNLDLPQRPVLQYVARDELRPLRLLTKALSRQPLRAPRPSRKSIREIAHQLRLFDPQLAVVSEVLAETISTRLVDGVPWIYDSYDVSSDLYSSLAQAADRFLARITYGIDARRIARVEGRLLESAHAVLAASVEDAERLRVLCPAARVVVVASSVPTPPRATSPQEAGPVALFVGTLDYLPNVRAVEELVRDVLPRVRTKVPDARLLVVGRRPTASIRTLLGSHDWITFREGPPELGSSYREARCALLPIRHGSGSRLKVYEALAHGVPVVGTTLAGSGIPLRAESGFLCGDSSAELAAITVELMLDEQMTQGTGAAAREYFLRHLTWEHPAASLEDVVQSLTQDADLHGA